MDRSRVVIVPCDSYDDDMVYGAVKNAVDILGGIEAFVSPDEKILVKPNFLSAAEPEKAVTTHPAVTGAVFRLLKEAGCTDISYGDSPGHGSMEAVVHKSGHDACAEKYGVRTADMQHEVLTYFGEGQTAKSFYFSKGIAEADVVINVCKMKTHALEKITGAVKNVYGYVCGRRKAAGHLSYPNAGVFARMLCDIHRCKGPRLSIMDGITAMEGNGPGSGDPKAMNVIIASADPAAIDSVFCALIDLDPELVPTNVQAEAMGIGHYKESDIELILCEPSDGSCISTPVSFDDIKRRFADPAFNVDRTGDKKTLLSRYSDLMTELTKKPYIDKNKCIRCGICTEHCPVPDKAVFFRDGRDKPPVYDYKKCIRCYCCQEMCPQHAIRVKGRN